MVQATVEKLLEDIDTALLATGNFSSLTIYNVDKDEDEDVRDAVAGNSNRPDHL